MRKQKIVFFIGAGFSAPFGLPVMSNFMDMAREFENEHIDRVRKFVGKYHISRSYLDIDFNNIEQLLSIAYIGALMENDKEDLASIQEFIKATIKGSSLDTKEYLEKFPFPQTENDAISDSFSIEAKNLCRSLLCFVYLNSEPVTFPNIHQFREKAELPLSHEIENTLRNSTIKQLLMEHQYIDNRKFSSSFITLNYDTLLESSVLRLEKAGLKALNSLSKNPLERDDEILLNNHIQEWGKKLRESIVHLHGNVDDEIIPPIWNKSISEHMLPRWQKAYKCLSEADYIVFLGYSLPETDNYVKFLLASAIGGSQSERLRKIYVIDKDEKGTYSRYKTMFSALNEKERLILIKSEMSDFLYKMAVQTFEGLDFDNFERHFSENIIIRGDKISGVKISIVGSDRPGPWRTHRPFARR